MAEAHHHHDHDHAHEHDTHGHHHGHGHSHAPKNFGRAFLIGIVLNTGFVVVEAAYGFLSGSLALIADAGHNLSDVLGLVMAWGASILAKKPPSTRFTYGLRSSTILAALMNAVVLLIAIGGIAWEAIRRFGEPTPMDSETVIAVALVGVVINTATALMFMSGRKEDLNVRGAFLHMAADAAITLGVVLAGIVILFTGWYWLDPAMSLIIAILIVYGTWDLLRSSLNLALHAVPEGIDAQAVHDYLASVEGVSEVHDLHIWGMSTTETALTAHLVFPAGHPGDAVLSEICGTLHRRFAIGHSTIQIEMGDAADSCHLAPSQVV